MKSPARSIDHTLLRADATQAEIARVCEEAVEYGFASICIPPRFVSFASGLLYGSEVACGTVVGFPLGYEPAEVKVFQTGQAVEAGASEIDMVISLGAARESDWPVVAAEISAVVRAAEECPVKVIIECCLFEAPVKERLAELVASSGAAYVKTSTGFAATGATLEDVALLCRTVNGRIGVKAAGGIRDWETCQMMLQAGAGRIGTSSSLLIMEQWQRSVGLVSKR